MREKTIEQKLVQAVKAKGGIALKFVSPGFSGVPDRLIPIAGWEMRLRGSQGPWRKAHGRCRSQGYGFCGGWGFWHSSWMTRARSPTSFQRSEVTAVKFEPHDYQQYAIEYIETHEVAAVLLDMGPWQDGNHTDGFIRPVV